MQTRRCCRRHVRQCECVRLLLLGPCIDCVYSVCFVHLFFVCDGICWTLVCWAFQFSSWTVGINISPSNRTTAVRSTESGKAAVNYILGFPSWPICQIQAVSAWLRRISENVRATGGPIEKTERSQCDSAAEESDTELVQCERCEFRWFGDAGRFFQAPERCHLESVRENWVSIRSDLQVSAMPSSRLLVFNRVLLSTLLRAVYLLVCVCVCGNVS